MHAASNWLHKTSPKHSCDRQSLVQWQLDDRDQPLPSQGDNISPFIWTINRQIYHPPLSYRVHKKGKVSIKTNPSTTKKLGYKQTPLKDLANIIIIYNKDNYGNYLLIHSTTEDWPYPTPLPKLSSTRVIMQYHG